MKSSAATMTMGAALLALGFLAGPAAAQQNSGFLTDYSQLAPAADNPKTKLWISKTFDFKPYQKVLLDPVEVWVSPTSEYKGASPDMLKRMSDSFTNSFKKALQPGYQLANEPGPGVLRISLAITGINLVKPEFKPHHALPVMFAVRAATGAMDAKNAVLTGEMRVTDPGGNVVAAAVATGTSDTAIEEKKEITWKDLQSITDNWSKGLRKRLDDARGVSAKK